MSQAVVMAVKGYQKLLVGYAVEEVGGKPPLCDKPSSKIDSFDTAGGEVGSYNQGVEGIA